MSTLHAVSMHFTNKYRRTFEDLPTDQRSRRLPTSSSQPPTPHASLPPRHCRRPDVTATFLAAHCPCFPHTPISRSRSPPFDSLPQPLLWTLSVRASVPGALLCRASYLSCLTLRASMHFPSTRSCLPALPPPPPHLPRTVCSRMTIVLPRSRPCPRSRRATVFSLKTALTVSTDTWTCCSLRHVFSLLYWTLRLMSVLCFCLPGKE